MDIRIEIVRDENKLFVFRDEWNSLLESCNHRNVFLSWHWMSTWWSVYGKEKSELYIVLMYDNDLLVSIIPFVKEMVSVHPFNGISLLKLMGTGESYPEYLDIICLNGYETAVLDALSSYLLYRGHKDWDVLNLHNLLESSLFCQLIARPEFNEPCHIMIKRYNIPYLSLASSWESLMRSLTANMRSNIRRRRKKVAKAYGESWYIETASDITSRMDILQHLHRLRWESSGLPGTFSSEKFSLFHNILAKLLYETGHLRLFLLWINHDPVAALYGFLYNNKFHYYQSGANPAYRSIGVGAFLMELCMEYLIVQDGAKEFDFLTGEEDYKSRWTKQNRLGCWINVYNPRSKIAFIVRQKDLFFLRIGRIKRMIKTKLGN